MEVSNTFETLLEGKRQFIAAYGLFKAGILFVLLVIAASGLLKADIFFDLLLIAAERFLKASIFFILILLSWGGGGGGGGSLKFERGREIVNWADEVL